MMSNAEGVNNSWMRGPAWDAIWLDPTCCVLVVSTDGLVAASDPQADRAFGGDAPLADRTLAEALPAAWGEAWLSLIRRVADAGRPIASRAVWDGREALTLASPVRDGLASERVVSASAGVETVLLVVRLADVAEPRALYAEAAVGFESSPVIDLGPLDPLTNRELEVLAMIGEGLSIKRIAYELKRSEKTIENHRRAIGQKLKARDRVQLAAMARRAGLTREDAGRERVER